MADSLCCTAETNTTLLYIYDLVAKLYLTTVTPWTCSLPGSSVREISQKKYWSGLPFL